MTVLRFRPFLQQRQLLESIGKFDEPRIKVQVAAKRSGKSEGCYIETIMKGEMQHRYDKNSTDPYTMAIVGPTSHMMRTLVWPKFRTFAAPFEADFHKTDGVFTWKSNNTIIHGVSAEKIIRIEGKKISHIHITEAFQVSRHVFLECIARVSDTGGTITIDGSLGTNIPNPKQHWIYKEFFEKKWEGARTWVWNTVDNPYFPKDELDYMRRTLDPTTFRQLFEIDWDTIPENAVYSDFSDDNIIRGYVPNPEFETYISVDWGYAHPAAVGFYQYDFANDTVYKFDEIVKNKLLIDQLHRAIIAKVQFHNSMAYTAHGEYLKITDWICDIAGDQEREQTGKSNVAYFKKHGIYFKKRRTAVQYGIPIFRSYIKDGLGRRKFFIDEVRCPHSIDGIRRYHYAEKDGVILNENPVKKNDDCVDETRYFFVNILDHSKNKEAFSSFKAF